MSSTFHLLLRYKCLVNIMPEKLTIIRNSKNSNQMEFVTLIVNHIVKNGTLDKKILNDHPFNKHGNIVNLFEGKMETANSIVKRIDQLNNRIAVNA